MSSSQSRIPGATQPGNAGPGDAVRDVFKFFYLQANEEFFNGDRNRALSTAYWLLAQPDLPVLERAGSHLMLADSTEFRAYHAERALALYKSVRDQFPESHPNRKNIDFFVEKAEAVHARVRDIPDLPDKQPSEQELLEWVKDDMRALYRHFGDPSVLRGLDAAAGRHTFPDEAQEELPGGDADAGRD
ncbi:uncharacterized protein B0I36DRAFT_366903 [Microdochium trichocladiopsis]|uniref:Uncharacterized protein n=1 Tax=Microdochium trichocladiopsis TaxID=1682393 RepID=A0A9P8XZN9_9PEZI|nr:uncharacterized protein B0I36DRAFT_366903 [Microdochium trichocladiopsis]KAH7025005.1 hypothetical protein B0I36DRAFT_366903 [Microdochium trichocladiopsis]